MGKPVYLSDEQLEYIKTVFTEIGFQEDEAEEKLREEILSKVSK